MSPRSRAPLALMAVLATIISLPTQAQEDPKPFLHPLFTNNMVLQREAKAPIWGWATPGQDVTVNFQGKSVRGTAGSDGKWLVKIGPFKAGGPYPLTVSGPQTVTLENVMLGDVWLCSGQSNMEMGVGISKDASIEIQNADYPKLRLYTVPKRFSFAPHDTVESAWKVCAPDSLGSGGWGGFSAVAYYFGRELHQNLNVPVGLLHSSWGGTVAEAWTSADSLEKMPDFSLRVGAVQQKAEELRQGNQNPGTPWAKWWEANDSGSKETAWAGPDFTDETWKDIAVQGSWENGPLPNYDGVVWFRKTLNLPADCAGKSALLRLGAIDDRDTTWVNGTLIGATEGWQINRNYAVPAGILKPGKNVIAIRVLDTGGGGGFHTGPAPMKLEFPKSSLAAVPLGEKWKFQVGKPLNQLAPWPVEVSSNQNTVTVLYNAMIAPLEPFAIKGAIWYQGESNVGRGDQYKVLLPTLIKDWRQNFGSGDFPFYIVQLANYMRADQNPPADCQWARLRDAQTYVSQSVPNTGLAVTIDIGDPTDIHPKNKQAVGHRLALNALAQTYGRKVEFSGPIFQSAQAEGGLIRVKFTHAKGLTAREGKLNGFAIAGEDKKWFWAEAQIDGETVVLSSPNVPAPAFVRYAWGNNPNATLYNAAGLPAVPFRTDKD